MKFLLMALAALSLTACEQGSYFNADTKQLHSVTVGRLEATGTDLRVYEFVPQTLPDYICVYVAGDRKAGLQCVKKEQK